MLSTLNRLSVIGAGTGTGSVGWVVLLHPMLSSNRVERAEHINLSDILCGYKSKIDKSQKIMFQFFDA